MKPRGSTFLTSLLILLSPHISPYPRLFGSAHYRSGSIFTSAALVNFTIDDTSSLITYSPPDKWRSSTQACSTCLEPNAQLAYAGTWHDGTYLVPPASSAAAALGRRGAGFGGFELEEASGVGRDSENEGAVTGRAKTAGRRKQARRIIPFFTQKEESEDAEIVDQSLSAVFNFTGSAIYVYALVPLFAAAADGTPTSVNLSYTLDSAPAGTFSHTGSASSNSDSYLSSSQVFKQVGLSEGPHTLTIQVGLGSVFLLDYVVYTQESLFGVNNSSATASVGMGDTTSTMPVGTASGSPAFSSSTSTPPPSKSHNVATFAGAVGGSVGLLAVLALSLAFSIYRRRLRALRRDRAYRQSSNGHDHSINSFHTDASEDGPPMQGPAPFVPRYFPGTVITAAPPPYSPPASPSNEPTSGLLGAPVPSMLWSSRRQGGFNGDSDSASYADRPPPTPPVMPVPDVDDGYFAPPPSFQIAIATPVPAILAGLSGLASTSPSPAPRPSTPGSPVIPLLAPPPSSSSRLMAIANSPSQTPGAGLSGIRSMSSPGRTSSTRSSIRSVQITSEELQSLAELEPRQQPASHIHSTLSTAALDVPVSAITPEQPTGQPDTERDVQEDSGHESDSHSVIVQ